MVGWFIWLAVWLAFLEGKPPEHDIFISVEYVQGHEFV
jgi:hypothetical protein